MWYVAQAVGVIAMIISFLSFQGNTKKHILIYQMVASVFFGCHYGLLTLLGEEGLTGTALNVINIFRCTVFLLALNPKRRWTSPKIWVPVFAVLNTAVGLATWTVWYSILPVIGILFVTFAFIPKNPRTIRLLHLPSSPCWLTYNFLTGAWPAVITECFNLVSLTVAFVRFDLLGKDESAGKGQRSDESGHVG